MIKPEGIDALLEFLPYFQNERSRFGASAECDAGVMYGASLSRKAERFCKACYRHNFVQPFDWGEWHETASRLQEHPEDLDQADLETLGRLLTFHIRADRFNDGHLLETMLSGHTGWVLARLQRIRAGTGTPSPR